MVRPAAGPINVLVIGNEAHFGHRKHQIYCHRFRGLLFRSNVKIRGGRDEFNQQRLESLAMRLLNCTDAGLWMSSSKLHMLFHLIFSTARHNTDISRKVSGIYLQISTLALDLSPTGQIRLSVSEIYLPIVSGGIPFRRAGLREAAISFLKQATSENSSVLHQFVLDKARLLKAHLNTLEGTTLSVGDKHTGAIFKKAIEVLRCPEVCRIFGGRRRAAGQLAFRRLGQRRRRLSL